MTTAHEWVRVSICIDCAQAATNDECVQPDGTDRTPELKRAWSRNGIGWLIVAMDTDEYFSHTPCQACDESLAGDRMDADARFTVLTNDEQARMCIPKTIGGIPRP